MENYSYIYIYPYEIEVHFKMSHIDMFPLFSNRMGALSGKKSLSSLTGKRPNQKGRKTSDISSLIMAGKRRTSLAVFNKYFPGTFL